MNNTNKTEKTETVQQPIPTGYAAFLILKKGLTAKTAALQTMVCVHHSTLQPACAARALHKKVQCSESLQNNVKQKYLAARAEKVEMQAKIDETLELMTRWATTKLKTEYHELDSKKFQTVRLECRRYEKEIPNIVPLVWDFGGDVIFITPTAVNGLIFSKFKEIIAETQSTEN